MFLVGLCGRGFHDLIVKVNRCGRSKTTQQTEFEALGEFCRAVGKRRLSKCSKDIHDGQALLSQNRLRESKLRAVGNNDGCTSLNHTAANRFNHASGFFGGTLFANGFTNGIQLGFFRFGRENHFDLLRQFASTVRAASGVILIEDTDHHTRFHHAHESGFHVKNRCGVFALNFVDKAAGFKIGNQNELSTAIDQTARFIENENFAIT